MLRELNENEMIMVSGGNGLPGSDEGAPVNPYAPLLAEQGIESWGDDTTCPSDRPYSIEGVGACFATIDQANAARVSFSSVPPNNDPNKKQYEDEGWTYHYDTQNSTWARSRADSNGDIITITGRVLSS